MVRAKLSVNKILCETIIGIYPYELSTPQMVEFGFSFEYDCEPAIFADLIDKAIDYAILTEELKTFISGSKFNLLETLTAEVAKKILAFSPKITTAKVYCIKLNSLCPKAEIELRIDNEKNKY
jgi:FolB domain-containing protein